MVLGPSSIDDDQEPPALRLCISYPVTEGSSIPIHLSSTLRPTSLVRKPVGALVGAEETGVNVGVIVGVNVAVSVGVTVGVGVRVGVRVDVEV